MFESSGRVARYLILQCYDEKLIVSVLCGIDYQQLRAIGVYTFSAILVMCLCFWVTYLEYLGVFVINTIPIKLPFHPI